MTFDEEVCEGMATTSKVPPGFKSVPLCRPVLADLLTQESQLLPTGQRAHSALVWAFARLVTTNALVSSFLSDYRLLRCCPGRCVQLQLSARRKLVTASARH